MSRVENQKPMISPYSNTTLITDHSLVNQLAVSRVWLYLLLAD